MLKIFNAPTCRSLPAWLLALSFSGCATVSPVPVPQPVLRPIRPDPALMVPPLRTDYSTRAQNDMKKWRETLDATPTK